MPIAVLTAAHFPCFIATSLALRVGKSALGARLRACALVAGLAALAACEQRAAPAPDGAATDTPAAADAAPAARLTNRVWTRTDSQLPGVMLIFLSNGTLVQDSCWETHRLSVWRSVGGGALRWQEDTAEIAATIVTVSASELVLRLELVGGAEERRYVAATVPYLCPDVPR